MAVAAALSRNRVCLARGMAWCSRTSRPALAQQHTTQSWSLARSFHRRGYNSSRRSGQEEKSSYFQRWRAALRASQVEWFPIPVGLGIAVVGLVFIRQKLAEKRIQDDGLIEQTQEDTGAYKVTKRPWTVRIMSTLPLNGMSRTWGKLNELHLPVWTRVPGYKLYAWIFGCNLGEMKDENLKNYRNLAEFFVRELKPGVRQVDSDACLVSPADGTVLHCGVIPSSRRVEQVKGIDYSLDALLGKIHGRLHDKVEEIAFDTPFAEIDEDEFANVNGISYSLSQFMVEDPRLEKLNNKDASVETSDMIKTEAEKQRDITMLRSELPPAHHDPKPQPGHQLHFAVVYLAPGDYHRFHSPANWVVEKRRHFAGELYSVSPFVANRLANLFVVNERVVLLGRWKYGFFSMVPVGATNVGTIRINFDRDLRTNSLTKSKPTGTVFSEATYYNSSIRLGGHPLRMGEELGLFSLGSTIVLIFEAPKSFLFDIQPGRKIKVGQKIGHMP